MAKFYAKAPDGSDALLSIVLTGFTQSLQQNGWCKLPNGLLIQWSRGGSTFIYPIKYTSWVVCNANFETYDLANDVDGYTQTGFIINSYRLVQCDFGSWFESVIFDMFITIGY